MSALNRTAQEDSYRRTLRARVVRCQPVAGGFEVVLDDTVLFVESGGQPSDRGTVGGLPVLALRPGQDGAAIHLLPGAVSGEVEVALDWERRYDLMQQHTAQHVITATALSKFGLRTTAFHLGEEQSDIELDTPALAPEIRERLSAEVNGIVRDARPIRARWVSRDEMASLPVRSRRLPADLAGPIRLVEIEGVDLNTCGGTHLKNTLEIGAVAFAGEERLRGGIRLFFLAGDRVRRRLAQALERERGLTELLTCGPAEHLSRVERLRAEVDQLRQERNGALRELAARAGEALAGEKDRCAGLVRPGAEMEFLLEAAKAARRRAPEKVFLLAGGDREGPFVLAGPEGVVDRLKSCVFEALEGKGGGRGGVVQGRAQRLDRFQEALEAIAQAIRIQ